MKIDSCDDYYKKQTFIFIIVIWSIFKSPLKVIWKSDWKVTYQDI